MNLSDEIQGDLTVLSIDGRVDGATAPELERRINEIVARGGTSLLLDCEKMDYISSAGLRIFLMGAKTCQQKGGRMTICSLQKACRNVIEVGGFHTIIDCYDTRDDAVAGAGKT